MGRFGQRWKRLAWLARRRRRAPCPGAGRVFLELKIAQGTYRLARLDLLEYANPGEAPVELAV